MPRARIITYYLPMPAKKRSRKSTKSKRKRKLLIVESPTKARTLKSYLGTGYRVLASQGHLIDLPRSKLGVDIDADFEPHYIVVRGKAKVLNELKAAAKDASQIFLGSDPDREGEAIAYHIANKLQEVSDAPVHRVLFYEITEEEVKRALAEPTTIDMRKVDSQQARRILDRLVGYQVSPFLWKIIRGGLSAGRVQTVALRLLAEREKQITSFVPQKYWTIEALLREQKTEFEAKLPSRFDDKKQADDIVKSVKSKDFVVKEFKEGKRKASPPPPHKTSTLQQEASRVFGFSPSKTMSIAQQLYEGISLPDGRKGLITYMRTDSVRMSDKAVKNIRELISREYGQDYIPSKARRYSDKSGKVQGAHECIRPTNPKRTPESIKDHLTPEQFKIYWLIWKRAVASQASDALFETQSAKLYPEGHEKLVFNASGRKMVFDGFYRITREEVNAVPLPKLQKGQRVKQIKTQSTEHETEPPPRFTEASLIKTLEDKGIGRPSTYASIMSTLLYRGYVVKQRKALVTTPLGILVSDILVPNFPEVFAVEFTARMEEQLDKVEEGQVHWKDVLREFWKSFEPDLKRFAGKVEELKASVPEDMPLYYKGQSRYRKRKWTGKGKKGRGKK